MIMPYTIPITKEMAVASSTLSVSPRHAVAICRAINRKDWKDAKFLVVGLADQTRPLSGRWKGKYYSKAASQISKLLDTVAANARQKSLDPDSMQLLASAHQGPTLYRGRRKRKFGMRIKIVHVQTVLKSRPEKKVEKELKQAQKEKKAEK
jgi:ribosomal protein L22